MLYCLFSTTSRRPVLVSHDEGYKDNPGWQGTALIGNMRIKFRVTNNKNTVRKAYKSPHPSSEIIPLVMLYNHGLKDITVNGVPFVDDSDPDAPD